MELGLLHHYQTSRSTVHTGVSFSWVQLKLRHNKKEMERSGRMWRSLRKRAEAEASRGSPAASVGHPAPHMSSPGQLFLFVTHSSPNSWSTITLRSLTLCKPLQIPYGAAFPRFQAFNGDLKSSYFPVGFWRVRGSNKRKKRSNKTVIHWQEVSLRRYLILWYN